MANEQMSLDNVLNEKAPPEVKELAKETTEVVQVETKDPVEKAISIRGKHRDREQEAQGRVRDPETGQFKPVEKKEEKVEVKPEVKVETKPEKPAQPELTDKEKAFLRGMQEERQKRQDLEKKFADLEAKLPKEPEKKFYDDPDGALEKLKQERDKERQEFKSLLTTSRIETSEMIARSRHTDFDEVTGEKAATFTELLQATPGLYQQFISAPDPAEFAYNTCKRHKEFKDAGSIDALRAKIEKETRLKIEGELKDKAERLEKERNAIPPSLSEAPSKGGGNRVVWGGPTPLANILSDK